MVLALLGRPDEAGFKSELNYPFKQSSSQNIKWPSFHRAKPFSVRFFPFQIRAIKDAETSPALSTAIPAMLETSFSVTEFTCIFRGKSLAVILSAGADGESVLETENESVIFLQIRPPRRLKALHWRASYAYWQIQSSNLRGNISVQVTARNSNFSIREIKVQRTIMTGFAHKRLPDLVPADPVMAAFVTDSLTDSNNVWITTSCTPPTFIRTLIAADSSALQLFFPLATSVCIVQATSAKVVIWWCVSEEPVVEKWDDNKHFPETYTGQLL
ncbi:hypothetical protein BJ741DRAFT_362122 [Chytriomyces cf. hyalinus JEL632]|nr:hypothetical protein BJ741DRAFT_362122 [Chytriomyces cf. hyalinus JEL632]